MEIPESPDCVTGLQDLPVGNFTSQNKRMKKVAIPVTNGRLSEFFGHCSQYEVFELNQNQLIRQVLDVPEDRKITGLPEWAARQGITDIITYKAGKDILSLFRKNKINFFIGVPVDESYAIIRDYLNGSLKSDDRIIKEIMIQE